MVGGSGKLPDRSAAPATRSATSRPCNYAFGSAWALFRTLAETAGAISKSEAAGRPVRSYSVERAG